MAYIMGESGIYVKGHVDLDGMILWPCTFLHASGELNLVLEYSEFCGIRCLCI